ncbi:MAG TPA: peptidylprolyl isomerase [Kofleriaceae bacterium]|nr:peptidylprolyl isomerase [Kofleriaceae bacterium]
MRPLFLIVTLLAGLGTAAEAQPQPKAQPKGAKRDHRPIVVDRVVAVVNDDVILNTELLMRAAPLIADLDSVTDQRERERRTKKIVENTLDDMINEELMVQAAVDSKLEVKDKEIRDALDEIKRQNKLDDAGLEAALAQQGFTIPSYKKDVRRQLLRMRAMSMLVRPRVSVTDEDIRARYDEMSRRSSSVSKVHLHHVLIALPDKPNEAQLTAAKDKAADVMQRARAGESFEALAKQYSDDGSTSADGGDLGMIEPGTIATEWEEVVFSMEQGEVRGPVSGPRGLHVFYVSELVKDDVKPFEEVKEQIRNELYRREMDKQTRQWMDELRKKAYIVKR